MTTLSPTQQRVLKAIIIGWALKVHRTLDGRKMYRLHPLEGQPETVRRATVKRLRDDGLIDSNKKFPAATYLLTEKGRRVASALSESDNLPLTAKNY